MFDLRDLTSVDTAVILPAKTDENGHGYKYNHKVVTLADSVSVRSATDISLFSKNMRQLDSDLFLSYEVSSSRTRRYPYYERCLAKAKATAIRCGLNARNFGTHFMRIGGAPCHLGPVTSTTVSRA